MGIGLNQNPPTLPILSMLRLATSSYDLADILDVEHRYLTYVLYGIDDSRRYREHQIEKKFGGHRDLLIPHPKLKDVQRRLARVLLSARTEAASIEKGVLASSYGFEKKRGILENAQKHTNRLYVFNLDLNNFFGSIRYGQLKGILERDRNFALSPKIAELIAQLCCYNSKLPQGAPTSPVASNIVAAVLDRRLRKLSLEGRCTYSRYVDDITFSTNQRRFPELIATLGSEGWRPSKPLEKVIKKTGFEINYTKVRMCLASNQQTVTGLTVNTKASVPVRYRKETRAMAHRLFTTGAYFLGKGEVAKSMSHENTKQLEGRIQFAAQVAKKSRWQALERDGGDPKKLGAKKSSEERLAEEFAFFKHFNLSDRPVIVTEGYTDYLYLTKTRSLGGILPESLKAQGGYAFKILRPTFRTQEYLQIGNGVGDVMRFVRQYKENRNRAPFSLGVNPVLLLIDSDSNGSKTWKALLKLAKQELGDQECYLGSSLYAIYLSHLGTGKEIESYFELSLLNEKINGKSFEFLFPDRQRVYKKIDFARKIVGEKATSANSKNFALIFRSIEACMRHADSI